MPSIDLNKWSRENWDKVDAETRKRCLDHLDRWISRKQLAELKTYRFDPEFHMFGGGMAIRNRLREVLPDAKLPGVHPPDFITVIEIRGNTSTQVEGPMHNWDDYYQGALDELLERL